MTRWFQRFAIFALIAGLILAGLGWATYEALNMEAHRRESAAMKERSEKLRRALGTLDGVVSPKLAAEKSRAFAHFSALHAPIPAMNMQGVPYPPGSVRVPSPLMEVDLPSWVMLHFQFTPDNKPDNRWQSPQVLPIKVRD